MMAALEGREPPESGDGYMGQAEVHLNAMAYTGEG